MKFNQALDGLKTKFMILNPKHADDDIDIDFSSQKEWKQFLESANTTYIAQTKEFTIKQNSIEVRSIKV